MSDVKQTRSYWKKRIRELVKRFEEPKPLAGPYMIGDRQAAIERYEWKSNVEQRQRDRIELHMAVWELLQLHKRSAADSRTVRLLDRRLDATRESEAALLELARLLRTASSATVFAAIDRRASSPKGRQ